MATNDREPRREPTRYFVDYDGERYILGPENTLIYLHHDCDTYNHIYVQFDDDENGEAQGTYLFKYDPRYTEVFESMVSNLISIQCTTITQETASEFDKEQYHAKFGEPVIPEVKEPTKEIVAVLTERQINRAKFLGYLLLHDHLTADDFNGEGELYL